MNIAYLERTPLNYASLVLSGLGSNHRYGFEAGRLIRIGVSMTFALLLMVLLTPDAVASCVINKTSLSVWVEYYGTRAVPPTFNRGGEWLKPGQSICLKGRSGDWLLLSPDWINGKPSDWAARETRRLGGTQQMPRFHYLYVAIATDDAAEITGFSTFADQRGWWVKPTARYRTGHTPSQRGSKLKNLLGQILNGLAEAASAEDGNRLTSLANQYHERGEYAAAEAFYREAYKQYERQLGKNHWQTAVAASSLGACLTTLERYEEAERYLVDSFELLKSRLGIRDENTRQSLNRLIRLYESAGAYDAAAEYRALLR